MEYRIVMSVSSVLALAAGLALSGFKWQVFRLYHPLPLEFPEPIVSDPAAMAIWSGFAFAQILGAVLLGLGVVLGLAGGLGDPRARVVVSRGAFVALLVIFLGTSMQMDVTWDGVAIKVTAAVLGVLTLAHGYVAVSLARAARAQ